MVNPFFGSGSGVSPVGYQNVSDIWSPSWMPSGDRVRPEPTFKDATSADFSGGGGFSNPFGSMPNITGAINKFGTGWGFAPSQITSPFTYGPPQMGTGFLGANGASLSGTLGAAGVGAFAGNFLGKIGGNTTGGSIAGGAGAAIGNIIAPGIGGVIGGALGGVVGGFFGGGEPPDESSTFGGIISKQGTLSGKHTVLGSKTIGTEIGQGYANTASDFYGQVKNLTGVDLTGSHIAGGYSKKHGSTIAYIKDGEKGPDGKRAEGTIISKKSFDPQNEGSYRKALVDLTFDMLNDKGIKITDEMRAQISGLANVPGQGNAGIGMMAPQVKMNPNRQSNFTDFVKNYRAKQEQGAAQ